MSCGVMFVMRSFGGEHQRAASSNRLLLWQRAPCGPKQLECRRIELGPGCAEPLIVPCLLLGCARRT